MSRQFTYYGSFASAAYFTDLFGVPYMPFSIRKLSPNAVYSGACLRVRRSSDNTEQDINFVSSAVDALLDTSSLLTFAGAGSAFVVKWYFQDSSGKFLEQTTASNQPRIVNSGTLDTRNSLPAVIFDGANDFMSVSSTSGLTISPTSFYAVSGRGANYTTGFPCVLATGILATSRGYGILYGSGNFGITANGLYAQSRYTTSTYVLTGNYINTLDSPNLLQSITTNTQDNVWFNGGSQATSNFTEINNTTTENISIGARLQGGTPFFHFLGSIQEGCIYLSDKTSQQSAMATNIKSFYGIL